MRNRFRIIGSIAVAAVFLSANPASAGERIDAYETIYYSDASKTEEVGYMNWTGCNRWGHPTYFLAGSSSAHFENIYAGYCEQEI